MYTQNLTLNNLLGLICHKKPTNQPTNQPSAGVPNSSSDTKLY